jgi:class 3 adenylate cyclase
VRIVRVDRGRCIGAGNCITLAPTAFDWLKGEALKADVVDAESVDEELLREAVLACPTQAIIVEEVDELLPWQLRGAATDAARRVAKTFMFTDIVRSTNLAEALGDEAWEGVVRWHDQTLQALFAAHHGSDVSTRGDGFLVSFEAPDAALACAVAIQRSLAEHRRTHGFAPEVRIGIHAADATQIGRDFVGRGVHEAARIAALAGGGEIVASGQTLLGTRFRTSHPRTTTLKGISEPVEVVSVEWQ